MKALGNNCRYSTPRVYPKNWQTCAAIALKKDWYIKYTFYDGALKESKQVKIRAGKYDTLDGRREFIESELENIKRALEKNGYNPITGESTFDWVDTSMADISPNTGFVECLRYAYSKLKKAPRTMEDIERVIDELEVQAKKTGMAEMPIKAIGRKDLRLLFEACAILKKSGNFSDDKYNRIRTYTGIVYAELIEFEAVEANIPLTLKTKDKAVKKIRETLTPADRKKIDKHFKEHHYTLWRFVQIFFHSGSRGTEIMGVKVKDVDLKNQRVKYLILKGREYVERYRPIRDNALSLWQEVVGEAKDPEMYVFSRNRKPGYKLVGSDANRLFWYRICKKELGITADFYSLKHLNTTMTISSMGMKAATIQMGESEAMLKKHYDTDAEQREHDEIKKVDIKFA